VHGLLVDTHSGQRRILHELSLMCTFSVGIVAMVLIPIRLGRGTPRSTLLGAEPLQVG
jgi:hypothetical protein